MTPRHQRAILGAMLVNAYATVRAPLAPAFPHDLRSRRDRSDPELAKHLRGFMGFVMGGGKRKMNQSRYHVLGHIERVQHQFAMEVDPAHLDAVAAWAFEANAILFLPDATIRAPDGKVLVAPDTGDAQPGADVPYPADARRRKQQTEAALKSVGVAVALRAESLQAGDGLSVTDLRRRVPNAVPALSPKERLFLEDTAPSKQDVVNYTWRYEALATLAWAIGVVDRLPFPNQLCDVPELAKAMLEREVLGTARLRPNGIVLDELDLNYRLHWAAVEARAKNLEAPGGIESGVVNERHYALNWLVQFQEVEWDEVDTPT